MRIAHFTDKGTKASLYHLLEKIEEYHTEDFEMKRWISEDRSYLINNTDLKKIKDWRNKVVAHLNGKIFLQDSDFFDRNKLNLLEIRKILEKFEQIIKEYGFRFLERFDYTRSTNVKKVANRLFGHLRCDS